MISKKNSDKNRCNHIYADIYYSEELPPSKRLLDTSVSFKRFKEELDKSKIKSDSVKLNYTEYKTIFKDLYNEFSNKGLLLNGLDYNLILSVLNFMGNNYKQSCLVLNEMLELYKNNRFKMIKQTILKDFSIINIKTKEFYEKYKDFFDIFDDKSEKEFLSEFDYYISFLFYIAYNLDIKRNEDKRKAYLKKVADNLNEINKLDIDKVYLNFTLNIMRIGEIIKLYYQPEGEIVEEYLSRIYYREDNVFSDACPNEKEYIPYLNNNYVTLFFHHPKFIIKTVRKKGFRLESGGNFDERTKEMEIYDFMFESHNLPSKDKLENSRCTLESYEQLIHMQKIKVLKEKLTELGKKIDDMKLSINDIIYWLEALGIDFEVEDNKVFNEDEMKVLGVAHQNVKKIR